MSLKTKILEAAVSLENKKKTPFTASDLAIEAWKIYPKEFGIRGYETIYPSDNRVLSEVMGATRSCIHWFF